METGSTIDALVRHATRAPQSIAYLDEVGSVTFGALHAAARRGAAWLSHEGVRSGDTVAMALDSSPAGARRALELFYAAGWIGAVILPLFPDVPKAARIDLIKRYSANWLLASGAPPQVAQARSLDPLRFDPRDPGRDDLVPPRGDHPHAGFVYVFTSGTTGSSKTLLSTHFQTVEKSRMVVQLFGFDAGDRILPIAPWPSFVGMRTLLRAHLAGAALVSAWIDKTREALGDTLRRYGVTRMYATPWHLRRLLQSPAPSRPWPPLRSVNTTGAAITIEEIMAARSQLAPNLFVEYGTNEISYVAQLRPDAAPLPGCVGSLLPGVEMRADDESGNPLPPGQVGDLGFRCAWMCSEYAGNPEATRLHFRGGWFYPGDAGYLDAGNRLFISGRTLEAINCGGLKIWPDEIESVIKRHPMVTDVAVVGLPHPLAGQIAAAFVVLRPTIVLRVSPRELHEFCAISLEKPRVPPHFFIVARIPRNQAGKVMRDNLISAYPGAAEMVRDS